MDKSQVLEKVTQYTALVSEKINPKKVVLYGSFAKGNWKDIGYQNKGGLFWWRRS